MLSAMHNGDGDHVRALLDHRAQRADIPPPHTRYSAFSDRSDSPSLYSNYVRNTPVTPTSRYPLVDQRGPSASENYPVSPISPRDRLTDPNASTLDLSEDTQFEVRSHVTNLEDDNTTTIDDTDSETRISLLGPRVRVHSRAPWETGEDDNQDSDNDDGGTDGSSIFGGKKNGRSMIRGLGFGSNKAPGPRPSLDSCAPSRGKRSFETTSSSMGSNSHNALHALAQASVSTTSLALTAPHSASVVHHKAPIPRLPLSRSRAASTTSACSERNLEPHPPLPSPRSALIPERGNNPSHSPSARKPSPSRSDNPTTRETYDLGTSYIHPYANPALLSASERDSLLDPFGNHGVSGRVEHSHISRNDSLATISASEETVVLSQSVSTSLASTSESSNSMTSSSMSSSTFSMSSSTVNLPKTPTRSTDASIDKLQRKARRETKLGPISAPSKLTRSEFSVSAPYNLISLEEAQALARERSRAASGGLPKTADIVPPLSASAAEYDFNKTDTEWPTAPRSRTISAGAYSKHSTGKTDATTAIGPNEHHTPASTTPSHQVSSPVGAGKSLKPKRSGFLKLFNGREKDRPLVITHHVPSSNEEAVSAQAQFVEVIKQPSCPTPTKVSSHRVPVPSLSPPPMNGINTINSKQSVGPSVKKPVPALSIKVSAPMICKEPQTALGGVNAVSMSRRSDSPNTTSTQHLLPSLPPASAPPGTTQFATLSLRPVSAFFSDSFADHLIQKDESPSLTSPTALTTGSSSSSPLAASFGRGAHSPSSIREKLVESTYSDGTDISKDGDPSLIISALQDQFRESRKIWQRQIWELEGQVRDLRAELDELRSGDSCEVCGRGQQKRDAVTGVIHRPRAKTGTAARFASGNDINHN